jgi:YceI-like domain
VTASQSCAGPDGPVPAVRCAQSADSRVRPITAPLRGVTQPISLTFEINGFTTDPAAGNMRAGFSAAGEINRMDFGVCSPVPDAGGLASNKAKIDIEAARSCASMNSAKARSAGGLPVSRRPKASVMAASVVGWGRNRPCPRPARAAGESPCGPTVVGLSHRPGGRWHSHEGDDVGCAG